MSIIPLNKLSDIPVLRETTDVEFKLAGRRFGFGSIPHDLWESYSAFANTRGGVILLGIQEKKGQLTVKGIKNPAALINNIWKDINNPKKTNYNLLRENDIRSEIIADKQIIRITVPRAPRELRPIFINNNPLTGTYMRDAEEDKKCLPNVVKRMLAERENIRDKQIFTGFSIEDISQESLRIYRQLFTDANPRHPFSAQNDINFLHSIRAWRKDRINKTEGLTLAGLVMFGKWAAIQEALPNYALDYQEKDNRTQPWIERIYSDGSWSGNAFDFYRLVYKKLTIDSPHKNNQQTEAATADEAIREALINTIAQADFSSEGNILIEKHPDFIGFCHSGLMRISVKEAISGGHRLCRNPAILQMFVNLDSNKKAESGLQKIYSHCRAQHWQYPHLYENDALNRTLLELRLVNIASEEFNHKLVMLFGNECNQLSALKRTILITAITESWFSHERIASLCTERSRDITLALTQLIAKGYLQSSGPDRDKRYHLTGIPPAPEKSMAFVTSADLSKLSLSGHPSAGYHPELGRNNPELKPGISNQENERPEPSQKDPESKERPTDSPQPKNDLWQALLDIAKPIRSKERRASSADVEKTIIQLLKKTGEDKYIKLPELAELLGRNSDTLRKNYLNKMLKKQKIGFAFPTKPNHPEQGYTIKRDIKETVIKTV